jgi:purine catabolism regulatory family protein/PucR-like helix-turn-helix protein/diguanylate cyclase with GGDEF domain
MPRLSDLVGRPELGIEVLCGALEHEVRWVHVTELPDPTPYLREAELVLTNGLWLTQGVAVGDYVARIASSHACGVLFGLLVERPQAPPELVAACRQAGLVLLTLPIEVPFTAVSQAMAELQADVRQRELARSISRGDALAQAVARGEDARGVLRLLTQDFDLPVALVDAGAHVLAAEGTDAAVDGAAIAAALAGPARAEVTLGDGTVATLFGVGALDDREAALVCLRPLVELADAERAALEQTARFLTLELARRHALHAIESRFAGELLEILYDPGRRARELPGRLRSFAIDPDRPLATLSVAFVDEEAPPGLSELLGRELIRRGVPAVVPQGSDDAVAIVGWTEGEVAALGQELADVLARDWPGRRAVVGVGGVAADHRELRRSLLEAREARRVVQRRRRGPAVATFDHVGSHRMLMALHSEHTLGDFTAAVLGPIREHDARHRSDLEHTLRTFLDLGGRVNESAAALHVHVNTLRNRLAKVEELTGRDLSATDDRVDLYLALGVEVVHTDSGTRED